MKWSQEGDIVSVMLPGGEVHVSFPAAGGIRLRYLDQPQPWCPILNGEIRHLPPQVSIDRGVEIASGDLKLKILPDCSLRGTICEKEFFRTPENALTATSAEGACLRFVLRPDERIYGLGQDPEGRIDHRCQERRMWNQWGGHLHSGNGGVGFFQSSAGYGMLLNSAYPARFCFDHHAETLLDPLGEAMVPSPFTPRDTEDGFGEVECAGGLDIFLFHGNGQALLRWYYALTGYPHLPPKWAFGFLQCKNRYMNRGDLLRTARRLRAEAIPCDGLIIDWLWFREFGDLDWDERDWPQAEAMLTELWEMGFRISSAQHPFISENSAAYGAYRKQGFLNQVPAGKRVTYDHTNPAARAYWWEKTRRLYDQGLRGYWTDMGELEEHFEGTRSLMGGRQETHNAYAMMWAMGLYTGQTRDCGTRPFILSRSCCAGIQKYGAAVWSGDINASWQVLREQIRVGQGMAMSGIPWWCTDIGGFLTGSDFSPELYIRWMEWGVFCPLFRTHGTRPGNEAWMFGESSEKTIRALIRFRYMLLPYFYSLAMACALKGSGMLQPMAAAFPTDPVCTAGLEGQMVIGQEMIVAPVDKPGIRKQQVYLPEGVWIHYWSGRVLNGGWHTVSAPLGQVPLFIRGGAIIPVYQRIGRNTEDCGDMALLTFPHGTGHFDYYEDDGETENYLKGKYVHYRIEHTREGVSATDEEGKKAVLPVALYAPPAQEPFQFSAVWRGDEARLTLTLLSPFQGQAALHPDPGWQVTAAPQNQPAFYEMGSPAYHTAWQGEIRGRPGDDFTWTVIHTAAMRKVDCGHARFFLQDAQGEKTAAVLTWDHPALSAPLMAGCAPIGGISAADVTESIRTGSGFIPTPFGNIPWRQDPLFARNAFGYVDFRQLDPPGEGERLAAEAWSREILWTEQNADTLWRLRHDSPIQLILNGKIIFESNKKNDADVPVRLLLHGGNNLLLIRVYAEVERPYSGGEFGYSLMLESGRDIYYKKV